MQKLCPWDPAMKGTHCFCANIESQQGIKKCCRCGQWNVQGNNWTDNESYR